MDAYKLERLNFLVVDDNGHMRALVKSVLRGLGARNIKDATDGADAFKRLRTYAADIIICDWRMLPMDGLDFVRLVRTDKDSPNPLVPVIMLTGHTEANRVTEARDAGVNEFLAKPISAQQLQLRIRAVMKHPRSFVRAQSYAGPDRRRRHDPEYPGPERRKGNTVEKPEERGEQLTPEQVKRLLDD